MEDIRIQMCVASNHTCVAADGGVFFFEQLFNNVGCQNGLYIFYEDIGSQMCVAADHVCVSADGGVFFFE